MRTPELHLPSWDCSNMKEDTEWSSGGLLTMCQLTYHFQGRSCETNRRTRCYCLGIQQVKKHITFIYMYVCMCVHVLFMCVYARACTCAPCHTCTEVRGQFAGSSSVLFFGISRLNSSAFTRRTILLTFRKYF